MEEGWQHHRQDVQEDWEEGWQHHCPRPHEEQEQGHRHQHLKNDRNSLILTKQHCTQAHDLVGSELDEVRGQGLLGLTDGLPHNKEEMQAEKQQEAVGLYPCL